MISLNISKGLAKANKKSRHYFYNGRAGTPDLPGTRLKDNRVVSGRVFYNKDGLNVIFGSVFEKVFKALRIQC